MSECDTQIQENGDTRFSECNTKYQLKEKHCEDVCVKEEEEEEEARVFEMPRSWVTSINISKQGNQCLIPQTVPRV